MALYPSPTDSVATLTRADGSTEAHSRDHGRLIGLHVNVKAYGALGNNTGDDTAAIQAAIDAADAISGGAIVFFPPGVYKTSGPLTLNTGNVSLQGTARYSSSQGPIAGSYIYSSSSNENILTVTAPPGLSQMGFSISGLELVYSGSVGTGVCLDLTGEELGGQISGVTVDNVTCTKGGVGIKLGASVNVRFTNVSATTCDKGWQFKNVGNGNDGPNVASFDNCYAQGCITAGVSVEGWLAHSRWSSCVFQATTGPGFHITADGKVFGAQFDSCWWEFPGSDMIRITGGWLGSTFTNCRFDGSSGSYGGGGARNVFNLDAADASSISATQIVLLSPWFVNLNGGALFALENDHPSVDNDPYYGDIVILGAYGAGNIEGLRTHGAQYSIINGLQFTDAHIITNSVTGLRPAYQLLSNAGSTVAVRGDLGAIEFEELASDAAAGATNYARLYAKDNGAGKTQLVVRFPTGAVQVLATEP